MGAAMSCGLVRRDLRAMNSSIELIGMGEDIERRLSRAERWLSAYESRYSRFQPLSELSRLNARAGRPVRVSLGLLQLVELSLHLANRSGGLFDPTVLRDLEASGYDRSFELITPASASRCAGGTGSWREIEIDHEARSVMLPAGGGLDLGGIGKGWAVDRLGSLLGRPCLVNGGGDVFATGQPPGEDAWRIGIADPFRPDRDLGVVSVVDRGVATSSTVKRRWQVGDAVLHHLIDPRTGLPSTSDAVQVTVVTSLAALADYHAKVALLQGAAEAQAYLDREPDAEGLIVRGDGSLLRTRGFSDYQ
jgi:thiamine biosynthesis lipoprotein